MTIYKATITDKAKFVTEVLSPLLYQANTGWGGAEYEYDTKSAAERVYLLTLDGQRSNVVNVTGDSLEAIVRDVFKNL